MIPLLLGLWLAAGLLVAADIIEFATGEKVVLTRRQLAVLLALGSVSGPVLLIVKAAAGARW